MKNLNRYLLIFSLLSSLSTITLYAKEIKGTVKDEAGYELPGVNVVIKGSTQGVMTNENGYYTIQAQENNTLEFSYIGFIKQEVKIGKKDRIDIVLAEDVKKLDEVVVVGYGTTRKVDITGAVSSVKSDMAEERLVLSVGDVLKGKVSGVRVTTGDGSPGAGASINIRGTTSINGDSNPLYVIDGFMSETCTVSPGDIETIDILKDASSTAIYGARGANGVILITTKKGRKNKTTVNFYAMGGVQRIANKLDMMNSSEFVDKNYFFAMTYVPEAKWNPRLFKPDKYDFFQDEENNYYVISKKAAYADEYYGRKPINHNTNWQDEMTRDATIQDYRLNLSGGGEKNTYAIMAGYKSQGGIMLNTDYKNYSARANFTQELHKNVRVSLHSSLDRSYISGYANGTGSVIYNTLTQAPLKPADFDLSFQLPGEAAQLSIVNPVKQANLITNDRNNYTFITNGSLDIDIIKGLTLKLSGGYFLFGEKTEQYFPSTVAEGMSTKGQAVVANHLSERINNENTLTYNKTFNSIHKFGAMIGNSISCATYNWLNTYNTNFALEDLGVNGIGEGKDPLVPTSTYIKQTEASFFGRLNYDLDNKYLFKFTLRADGASKFAENNKWGYFPSGAAAWRISEEEWLKSWSPLSNMKLRLSWGISGKQAISSYQSLPVVGTNSVSIDGENNVLTSYFSRLANSNLKWETTEEWDLGYDLGFFDERLGFSVDLYHKVTRDLLYSEPVPSYSGYNEALKNIGKISNKGVEFSIYATPVKNRNFTWDVNFNISKNVSKVLSLGEQSWQLVNAGYLGKGQGYLEVGLPLGNWYGYKTNGIWQTQGEIDKAIANKTLLESEGTKPGYMKYEDLNKDGKITADDRQIIGNGMPKFTGGFTNSITYKGISLDFTLQFSYGNQVYNANRYRLESGISLDNALASTIDRWQPTLYHYDYATKQKGDLFKQGSPSNEYPIAAMGKSKVDETPIDKWIEDASFLRLADLTLSYSLPQGWLNKMKMQNMRIFLTGSNLFTLTKYTGYDPEVNVSQNSAAFLLPGLDYFSYPKSRTISAGINITF